MLEIWKNNIPRIWKDKFSNSDTGAEAKIGGIRQVTIEGMERWVWRCSQRPEGTRSSAIVGDCTLLSHGNRESLEKLNEA